MNKVHILHKAEDVMEEAEVDNMTMMETVLAVSAVESRVNKDIYFMDNEGDPLKIYKYMKVLHKLHDKLHFVIATMEAMSQMKVK